MNVQETTGDRDEFWKKVGSRAPGPRSLSSSRGLILASDHTQLSGVDPKDCLTGPRVAPLRARTHARNTQSAVHRHLPRSLLSRRSVKGAQNTRTFRAESVADSMFAPLHPQRDEVHTSDPVTRFRDPDDRRLEYNRPLTTNSLQR